MAVLTISSLKCFDGLTWVAELLGKKSQGGSLYKKRRSTLASSFGPTAQYGIDAMYAEVLSIAASGTANVDLNSFTDVLSQATVAMARLKAYAFILLSTDDTSLVTANASSVYVGGHATNPHPLNLVDAASDKLKLLPGDVCHWWTPTAAGIAVTAGAAVAVKFANQDATNAAKVAVVFAGSQS